MPFIIILSALILLAGVAGYIGIEKDPWYRRKLDRDKYPFEELTDSADDTAKRKLDDIIREFKDKTK